MVHRKSDLSVVGWWMVLAPWGIAAFGVVAGVTALLRAADTFALHDSSPSDLRRFRGVAVLQLSRVGRYRRWPRRFSPLPGGHPPLLTGWFGGELVFSYGISAAFLSP
jgi:hypothetical protein